MRGVELAGHPAADIDQAGVDGGLECRQSAAAQGAEAIADLEQFVEVFGDHQDRRVGVAQSNQRSVNGRGGADVHAPGRVRGHQQFGLLKDFAAEDEFLQVAAGQAAGGCLGVGRLYPEATDDFFGQRFDLATLDQSVADQPLLEGGEQGVVGQAEFRHRAVAQTLGGNECQTEFAPRIRS